MITAKSIGTGGLGRFCNQAFTIASTIGIAVKNGQPFGFPDWVNQDNKLFGGNADMMSEYFVNPLPKWVEGIDYTDIPYHWEYRDYNIPSGNWNICSHLQDPRYFEHCMPLIRETLRMKDEPEQNDFVALHFRAGDYQDDPNAYHPRCSKEYYESAMSMFPDAKFLVFSDDTAAFFNLKIKGNYFDHYSGGRYLQEFGIMKRCKHFITANSSFSFMAALLGEHPEKKIIMPSRWFGTQANIKFEGYPREAIVI